VDRVRALPGVADVAAGQDWLEGYTRALTLARGLGLALGGVLALATLLLVASTIRLALWARRNEVEILSLVGASRTYIAIPLVIEGALQGLLGGMLALVLLALGFRLLVPGLADALSLVLGGTPPAFFDTSGCLLLVAGGGVLGALGAALSLIGGLRR
jgi:cell division transport system permease protein